MSSLSSPLPPIEERLPLSSLEIRLLSAFIPLWLLVYYRVVLSPAAGRPDGFDGSPTVSNLHAVPLCILALLSLWEVVPEVVPLCWSLSFFVADLIDCVVRRDGPFFVHAIISLALNVMGRGSARHRLLRTLGKGCLTEASTPFLNHWKKSKSYASFVALFLAFTLCRMVWVPLFIHRAYVVHLGGELDYMIWPSVAFYLLQMAWYAKMCAMVVNYKLPKGVKERLKKVE